MKESGSGDGFYFVDIKFYCTMYRSAYLKNLPVEFPEIYGLKFLWHAYVLLFVRRFESYENLTMTVNFYLQLWLRN